MMRKGFRRLVAVEKSLAKDNSSMAVEDFGTMVGPSLTLVKQLGSLYTGSVFGGLYSLLYGNARDVAGGEQVTLFAYGSGLGATMFTANVSTVRSVVSLALLRRWHRSAHHFIIFVIPQQSHGATTQH
jgi:3-hydroxy-3-methylglutaryl CoA synthase